MRLGGTTARRQQQQHQTAHPHTPLFVAFDLMTGGERYPFARWQEACARGSFVQPALLCMGRVALPLSDALARMGTRGHHGAQDVVEGVVYRVERHGALDFLAKWVRPDKADGCYLPDVSGLPTHWNWRA